MLSGSTAIQNAILRHTEAVTRAKQAFGKYLGYTLFSTVPLGVGPALVFVYLYDDDFFHEERIRYKNDVHPPTLEASRASLKSEAMIMPIISLFVLVKILFSILSSMCRAALSTLRAQALCFQQEP